jgi:hypothetical protein
MAISNGRAGTSTTMTLDTEAMEFLRAVIPGPHTMGRFVSRLLLEEKVRREERAWLYSQVSTEMRNLFGLPDLEIVSNANEQ